MLGRPEASAVRVRFLIHMQWRHLLSPTIEEEKVVPFLPISLTKSNLILDSPGKFTRRLRQKKRGEKVGF